MNAFEKFEDFCKKKGMKPCDRGDAGLAEVFIAETEKTIDLERFPDYKDGFYQVAWFVASRASEGKLDVGQWIEFDANHDFLQPQKTRRQMRINVARKEAERFIENSIKANRI
ncbi:MAG TPA: hypothetical protein DCL39_15975 [Alteromonas macleodii]|nr:hypothetical protein [Alteromonas macleodii]HAG30960.1 hypothetical protein [Alteromonas macleodii]HAM18062.1 hypothetical protein [Alteromonas macleodii]HAX27877.1 hypothetical protein [Alteromonas macleodii]|tara:strand:- start:4026 stop:4364 length:339 start_codon:yes stop_codon:yes gene_type:complete